MKSTNILKNPLLLLAFAVLSFVAAPASAQQRSETVKPIKLVNLAAHQGQFLTVLYVVGTKPVLSIDARQLTVSEIKHVVASVPVNNKEVGIPAVELPAVGFRPAYNFVVVVFHNQPRFMWVNANGSIPADPRGVSPSDQDLPSVQMLSFSKQQLEEMSAGQGVVTVGL